jgi:hypothetical protein
MLSKIIEILSLPIMILNMAGGIVGGIWLAILGEWKLIGIGIFILITFHWILGILLMVNLQIAGIAVYFFKRKRIIGHVFGFISQFYINLLIVGTCVLAFYICSSFYKGDIGIGYTPYLLWSWGMALGDWQYFASTEPNNELSAITLFSASAFYLLFLVSIFINPILVLITIISFAVVQLIVLPICNLYIANQMKDYC